MKNVSIRMDEELLERLRAIAKYEGRSVNRQVRFWVRQCVEEFEKKHGKIPVER